MRFDLDRLYCTIHPNLVHVPVIIGEDPKMFHQDKICVFYLTISTFCVKEKNMFDYLVPVTRSKSIIF